MSLVRLLTLREDNTLGIEPVYAVQTPRSEHTQVSETPLPANLDVVLESIQGNAMELAVKIDPRSARAICLQVLRSPYREETTAIKIFQGAYFRTTKENGKRDADALVLDTSRSSLAHDVSGCPGNRAVYAPEGGTTQASDLPGQERRRGLRQRSSMSRPAGLPRSQKQRGCGHPCPGRRRGPALARCVADEEYLLTSVKPSGHANHGLQTADCGINCLLLLAVRRLPSVVVNGLLL